MRNYGIGCLSVLLSQAIQCDSHDVKGVNDTNGNTVNMIYKWR